MESLSLIVLIVDCLGRGGACPLSIIPRSTLLEVDDPFALSKPAAGVGGESSLGAWVILRTLKANAGKSSIGCRMFGK
jgi:hypothetical protein